MPRGTLTIVDAYIGASLRTENDSLNVRSSIRLCSVVLVMDVSCVNAMFAWGCSLGHICLEQR